MKDGPIFFEDWGRERALLETRRLDPVEVDTFDPADNLLVSDTTTGLDDFPSSR